ncbi:hypothetical protein ACJIZ3_002119 [Penstemon smallii]|uniref:Uncharacterized protein n=1 Tax=Penstemon smallii TaxID=265156 RepID=A0ABD3U5M6_9LAMI
MDHKFENLIKGQVPWCCYSVASRHQIGVLVRQATRFERVIWQSNSTYQSRTLTNRHTKQEPGKAEKSFARYDYATVMKKFMLITKTGLLIAPIGMEIADYLGTPSMNWELLAPWQGSKITVPTKLNVGNKDIGFKSGGKRNA